MEQNKTILAVDDQKHFLHLLTYNLKKTGFNVTAASTGEEAIEIAKLHQIDLLVIDYELPGFNGCETVRAIKRSESYRDLPTIMLTGRGQANIKEVAKAEGVTVFLTKPFSPTELLQHVQTQLDPLHRANSLDSSYL